MTHADVKKELAALVDWRLAFPGFVFRAVDFRFAYFFETPWTGRFDVGAELDRLLLDDDASDAIVSVEHAGDGTFDNERAAAIATRRPFFRNTGAGVSRVGSNLARANRCRCGFIELDPP
ncbi:hypothetical protein FIV34_18625 [Luteibacter pinisoli]|uniref:Uncharacterized protein n=1 Tax=Luteibacter pinisoli TaxID=2589080 RepID=A0A4Y5ZA27_9GAMM|nr:hypothetical protein [Luteibacter pinisoli]QDE41075.1 hypothetical protein FIV34_18625 [Luteibacter pinisoli]